MGSLLPGPETHAGLGAHEGDNQKLSINIKYVLEAVSSITSDSVRMEWIDDVHGIIFCPALGAGGVVGAAGELHLVMPMVV